MRTLLIISFIFFTAFTSAQPVSAYAELSARHHDFGTVKSGKVLKYDLFVKNTGKNPLVISMVTSSKSSVSPQWKQASILPGNEGLITLYITAFGMPREHNTTVEVQYNDDGSGPLRFKLKFKVAPSNDEEF
ncbi:MAG: DUF1573 domain-containing protein [Ignavibacteriaceae bacterium]|nr:DUF1573 domain-containing protein [Ignavibacteriaceae bacterium]